MSIQVNGIDWEILFVDPRDEHLIVDGFYTIGATDLEANTIYICRGLPRELLYRVIKHEICHAFIFSYEVDITIPDEECICQIMGEYGDDVESLADEVYLSL